MEFLIHHPRRPQVTARYGFDVFLGFFVDVREQRTCVGRYDALTEGYDQRWPLQGALYYLVEQGFFRRDELEEALVRGQHDLPEEMPRRVRRVAIIVHNFKTAAD